MKAKYGYVGRMLFVNLSDGKTRTEELSEDLAKKFIGGYGIGSRIMYERMKPGVDPLGPDNIFAIGHRAADARRNCLHLPVHRHGQSPR